MVPHDSPVCEVNPDLITCFSHSKQYTSGSFIIGGKLLFTYTQTSYSDKLQESMIISRYNCIKN